MRKTAIILTALMLFMLIPITGITSADENEPALIWEMTEDDVKSFVSNPDGHTYLRPAASGGRPVYSIGADGGIHMSNRNADWQSVDVRDDWMEPGKLYTIVAEFTSDEPVFFRFMNTDSPYGTLVISAEPDTHAELVCTTEITQGQRGVRLTTPQGTHADYSVVSIRIYEGGASDNIESAGWEMDVPSLRELFDGYFYLGNIMEPGVINDSATVEMFLHHFNSVTAENSMKPVNVAPSRGEWNLSGPDRLLEWAGQNNLRFHGHTLVWHSQSAPWLTTDDSGNPLTRSEAKENMEYFINHYVGHYKGRIDSWDVVNEAFTDGVAFDAISENWRRYLRSNNSPWYAAYSNGINEAAGECPSDYIYDAFVFTRLADPGAMLVYNDFNEETPGKRAVIAAMTEEFNKRWEDDPRNDNPDRLLIECLGMQAHYWTDSIDTNDVRDTILRFAQTGARVAITELDLPLGRWNAFGDPDDDNLEHQAKLYRELFEIFVELFEHIESVTIWGRADPQSWRAQGFPLLFNGRLETKPAFWAVVEVGIMASENRPFLSTEPADNIEPAPMPEVPPLPDAPQPEQPTTGSNSNIPPWWAIVLMIGGVVVIGIALYFIIKKK